MPWLQLSIQVSTTLIMLVILLHLMPYEKTIDNIFEFYNEATILVISLLLLPFSEGYDLDAE